MLLDLAGILHEVICHSSYKVGRFFQGVVWREKKKKVTSKLFYDDVFRRFQADYVQVECNEECLVPHSDSLLDCNSHISQAQ